MFRRRFWFRKTLKRTLLRPAALPFLLGFWLFYNIIVFISPWRDYSEATFSLPPLAPGYLAVKQTDVPRIIHQIWHERRIPDVYIDHVQKLRRDNPEWQYILWTLDDGRKLLKKHFPDILPFFEKCKVMTKADVIRYAVMYLYGGAYFDMDTESVKPLDSYLNNKRFSVSEFRRLAAKEDFNFPGTTAAFGEKEVEQPSTCLFSYEPPEHEFAYHVKPIVSTATLFCQKNHPLLLYILHVLPHFQENNCKNPVQCTGPGALTKILNHLNITGRKNGIEILESKYFQDVADKTVATNPFLRCLLLWIFYSSDQRFKQKFCEKFWRGKHRLISGRAVTYHRYDHINHGILRRHFRISLLL